MSTFATVHDLALLMARDPSTPSSLFIELSSSHDPHVLRALAENPSAPPEILRVLSQRYPEEVLQNPVLPLLLLESPEFFLRCSLPQLQALIFRAEFPRSCLFDLLRHSNARVVSLARRALLTHSGTEVFELVWLHNAERDLRRLVAGSSKAPPEVLEALLGDLNAGVRAAAARNPKAPQRFLALLRRAGASEDLSGFVAPGRVSREELQELSTKGSFARALWVRHPKTPVTHAQLSSCRYDPWWLAALASREDTPLEVLERVRAQRATFSCVEDALSAREAREAPMNRRGRRDKLR